MERRADNYKYLGTIDHWKVDRTFDTGLNAPKTHSAEDARCLVLAHAGGSAVRDAVDERLANDIKNRTGKLLDSQDEVGGWPELETRPAPKDADRDGMPDSWETANNLDQKNPDDPGCGSRGSCVGATRASPLQSSRFRKRPPR